MSRKLSFQVPGRHMAELPPPKRQIKEIDLWDKQEQDDDSENLQTARFAPIVAGRSSNGSKVESIEQKPFRHVRAIAYIAHAPRCLFSEDLLRLAQEVCVPVQVYDIDAVDAPEWLPGTPTLETETGAVYCGDAAFNFILLQSKKQLAHAAKNTHYESSNGSAPTHMRRKQHPDIVPRTLDTIETVVQTQEEDNAPYNFLHQPDALSHKPTQGGSLASVFAESARIEQLANSVQSQPERNAVDTFNTMMNARA